MKIGKEIWNWIFSILLEVEEVYLTAWSFVYYYEIYKVLTTLI